MGADNFEVHANGNNMSEAFNKATRQARYDYGHAGYTGTIAEKDSFVDAGKLDQGQIGDAIYYMEGRSRPGSKQTDSAGRPALTKELRARLDSATAAYDDKWGPAVGFDLGEGRYFFCGWASS